MDIKDKKYILIITGIFSLVIILFSIVLMFKSITPHEKIIIEKPQYVVRTLCLDNKEYYFINGEGSAIIENKDALGHIKSCNY